MEPNLGTRGATRQRWDRKINIQAIIREVQEAHPRANEDRLVRLLVDRARDDEDTIIAAMEYAVRNTLHSQQGYGRQMAARTLQTPQQIAERQSKIAEKVEGIKAQILILNLEMPNGKRMRYCTREEMRQFNGGYSRLIKKMKPGQMVGQAFSEQQVRALMQ